MTFSICIMQFFRNFKIQYRKQGFLFELMRNVDAKLLAVQYHPESSPGPHDSFNLFRDFLAMTVGGS